jgi:hypothetical protein
MKHVAILKADRRAERAGRLNSDCCSSDSLERPLGPVEVDPADEAFDATSAKNAEGGPHRFRWENLKPIIYHNAQDLTPEARRAQAVANHAAPAFVSARRRAMKANSSNSRSRLSRA